MLTIKTTLTSASLAPRRSLLLALPALLAPGVTAPLTLSEFPSHHLLPPGFSPPLHEGPAPGASANWGLFKRRYLSAEGRLVDSDNGGVSHSEGQAWGMFLAVAMDDRAAFDQIMAWTRTNLAIRGDRLLAWRYRAFPNAGVDDLNAATDADLFHAWALLRAEQRWPNRGYQAMAQGVAADILRFACRQFDGRVLLMPGAWGFDHPNHLVLNPSYYVFPALEALAAAFPRMPWRAVLHEGERMMAQARFGQWDLPADWVTLRRRGGALQPEPGRGERFGYDAVRIPLYLAWSGRWDSPVLSRATRFWSEPAHPFLPAWVQLSTGAISPFAASGGVGAIQLLAAAAPSAPTQPARIPPRGADQGYYSGALALLAAVARAEAPSTARAAA